MARLGALKLVGHPTCCSHKKITTHSTDFLRTLPIASATRSHRGNAMRAVCWQILLVRQFNFVKHGHVDIKTSSLNMFFYFWACCVRLHTLGVQKQAAEANHATSVASQGMQARTVPHQRNHRSLTLCISAPFIAQDAPCHA